jgi:anti-sigma B factor antagonist
MEGIEITESKVGALRHISLLQVKGYIDTMTCSQMLHRITELMQNGTFHMIVDMSTVNYVSSAGWGVFVGEIKNIREHGGDLKIVQMLPEVYDVFRMLEFDRILSSYDSIEEAITDFDITLGLDVTKSLTGHYNGNGGAAIEAPAVPQVASRRSDGKQRSGLAGVTYTRREVDPKLLPLPEKIKLAIIDNPTRGPWKIKKALEDERFGSVKVSVFTVYNLLRKLSLDSKEKRFRFYRSR